MPLLPRPSSRPSLSSRPSQAVPRPVRPRACPQALARLAGAAIPALLVGVALAGPAQAQRLSKIDGGALTKLCTGRTPVGCDAYVSGVADAAELLGRSNPEPTEHDAVRFCIPADTTGTALRGTVTAWADGHDADLKLPAAMLVVHALHASYPCKGGTPAGSPATR